VGMPRVSVGVACQWCPAAGRPALAPHGALHGAAWCERVVGKARDAARACGSHRARLLLAGRSCRVDGAGGNGAPDDSVPEPRGRDAAQRRLSQQTTTVDAPNATQPSPPHTPPRRPPQVAPLVPPTPAGSSRKLSV